MMKTALFPLGRIVATPGALNALEESAHRPDEFLSRHVTGDWGDLCADDRQQNELSLRKGCRLFSAYVLSNGQKLWIITEHDRSVTTLLLPLEY